MDNEELILYYNKDSMLLAEGVVLWYGDTLGRSELVVYHGTQNNAEMSN